MCGITGFIDFNKKSTIDIIKKMTNAIKHRGPDSQSSLLINSPFANIGLGHTRLSVIDLSEGGNQPMKDDSGEWIMVFNGEVYNYKEIRVELQSLGYNFNSFSDTEVVILAIKHFGIEAALKKLIGMFAFVLVNLKEQKVYFVRDRAGVKPFYYYQKDNLLLFASELKPFYEHPEFEKTLDIKALNSFIKEGYVVAPLCIFKNTFKLIQGHYAVLDLKQNSLKTIQYWSPIPFYESPKINLSEIEIISETEALLKSAVEYRMVADVPVGVFLSGGYDSSVVTALLQSNRTERIKTFTIGFEDDNYNEAPYAKKIAAYLDTDHTELYCTIEDVKNIIPKLVEIYDEPFGDSSAIPTFLVSTVAKANVKVALSADGGDEIFAGYNFYKESLKYYSLSKTIPSVFRKSISSMTSRSQLSFLQKVFPKTYNVETRINKFSEALNFDSFFHYQLKLRPTFSKSEINQILLSNESEYDSFAKEALKKSSIKDNLDTMLAYDYIGYMCDDILTKVDRASMSQGLESREPMLDHRLIEYLAGIPSELKTKGKCSKYLLKEITHKYIPKELLDRPKKGFSIPLHLLFKDDLKHYLEEYLSEETLRKVGLLDVNKVLFWKKQYLDGVPINFNKIWYPLVFQMWHKRWM
jgi:asparagine synthase (glutamine-hydrolysing)